jgi:hypothetical protein
MERRVVSRKRPDHAQKAHHERKARGPFRPVDDFRPDIMIVIRLGMVDGAYWEPDDEDEDNDKVGDCADYIQPADQLRRVHGERSFQEEKSEQEEVNVPGLGNVVGIGDFGRSHDHVCQGVVNGAGAGYLTHEVGPAGNLLALCCELKLDEWRGLGLPMSTAGPSPQAQGQRTRSTVLQLSACYCIIRPWQARRTGLRHLRRSSPRPSQRAQSSPSCSLGSRR